MAQNGSKVEAAGTNSKVPDGVVLPPKDIRAIVEKTAGYVARNGPMFEERIAQKEQSNSKFSFLVPGDAYAPFYQWRLAEIKAGRNLDPTGKTPNGTTAPPKGLSLLQTYKRPSRMLCSLASCSTRLT